MEMSIHFYFQSPKPWGGAEERAIAAGYTLKFITGPDIKKYAAGGFAVFKDGRLIKRFDSAVEREKWLFEQEQQKKTKKTLVEGIHGTWHYHLSDDGKTALCGARVMRSDAPEDTWGYVGHLGERYCKECARIRQENK